MADFTAITASHLASLYARLGEPAVHVAAAGGATTDLRVIFDTGGGTGGLDGMLLGDAPTVRGMAAALPAGLKRGDTLTITVAGAAPVAWRARENAVPIFDGSEWQAPLQRAA